MEQSPEAQYPRIKPYRKDFTYSYTEGVFPTIELIEHAQETVQRIIVSSKSVRNSGVALLKEKCCAFGIPFREEDQTIARICPKGSVLAVGVFAKTKHNLDPAKHHAVFVNPSDMGNLGTLLRTAVAFGIFDAAVIEPAADYYDPKTFAPRWGLFFAFVSSPMLLLRNMPRKREAGSSIPLCSRAAIWIVTAPTQTALCCGRIL